MSATQEVMVEVDVRGDGSNQEIHVPTQKMVAWNIMGGKTGRGENYVTLSTPNSLHT